MKDNPVIWIARDKDGWLCASRRKPYRDKYTDVFNTGDPEGYFLPLNPDWFPEITWENSPQKVELKLIKK